MQRRHLIKVMLASSALHWRPAAGSELTRTPQDYKGPFYPFGKRHRSRDLITGTANGKVLNLKGWLLQSTGEPVSGGLIEIWQTDPEGRYDHPSSTSAGTLRSEFRYFGETLTDSSGQFSFRTYVPGVYDSRPAPHIHYRVWSNRQLRLTSQLYFHELGGPGRWSRSRKADRLQTANLTEMAPGQFSCETTIVI